MGKKIAMFVNRAALDQNIRPKRGQRPLKAGSAIDDDELRRFQAAVDEIIEERPPGGLALSTARRTYWPSCLTPRAMSSEINVDFLSSRTRTTVPSRINRMLGSSAKERAFQASQSLFTLRQTLLTVSLPTEPPKRAASARRTRRVLVPER